MKEVELSRDVRAIRIPDGSSALLAKGSKLCITQSLEDSFTVSLLTMGGLFRIDGTDSDALGQEPPRDNSPALSSESGDTTKSLDERVWDQLRSCYDPEIPVNIVDLGLIYEMQLSPTDAGVNALVKMTLTAPGCGMGPSIAADAKRKIEALSEINEAVVELVWEPQWGPERISPAGRKDLGID